MGGTSPRTPADTAADGAGRELGTRAGAAPEYEGEAGMAGAAHRKGGPGEDRGDLGLRLRLGRGPSGPRPARPDPAHRRHRRVPRGPHPPLPPDAPRRLLVPLVLPRPRVVVRHRHLRRLLRHPVRAPGLWVRPERHPREHPHGPRRPLPLPFAVAVLPLRRLLPAGRPRAVPREPNPEGLSGGRRPEGLEHRVRPGARTRPLQGVSVGVVGEAAAVRRCP